MAKIKYENFDPLKIEIAGKKKVDIKFFDLELPNRKQGNEDKNLPHEKFNDALQALAPIMAVGLGLTKGWDFARDILAEKSDLDNLKKAKQGHDEVADNIVVQRVSFLGEKRTSIQLTGSVTTDYGTQKQTTCALPLDPAKFDQAENAITLLEELKKRAFAYLFQGEYTKTEKKKKEEADKAAVEQFDHAIENGGEFAPVGSN